MVILINFQYLEKHSAGYRKHETYTSDAGKGLALQKLTCIGAEYFEYGILDSSSCFGLLPG